MSPGTVARYVGIAGAAVSVVVAGAAAGVLSERKKVARRRTTDEQPLGSLRGADKIVVADDELGIHAEVDELEPGALEAAGATVIFVHGYALNLDCWHFQRSALRGRHRLVFYDQRSHGRSGRSRAEHCTFDQLGRDLAAVVEQLAPDAPVVLVGHSMGGMTIMSLAERHPDWFGSRVVGVALISTSSGGLDAATLGLPGFPGRLLHKVTPAVLATLARAPRLVESGRRASSDIALAMTRRLGFGGPVPQEYVDFTDEMLAATPVEVVADFFPGFEEHDKSAVVATTLASVSATVVGGGRDAITPVAHTRRIAELVPTAAFLELPDAGHMVILESHAEVSEALDDLVERAERLP